MIFSFGFFIFITCLACVPFIAAVVLCVVSHQKNWAIFDWLDALDSNGWQCAVALIVWISTGSLALCAIVCGIVYGIEYKQDQAILENNVYYVYEMETIEHPSRLQCETAENYNVKHYTFITDKAWAEQQKIDTTKMWAKFVRDVKTEEELLK